MTHTSSTDSDGVHWKAGPRAWLIVLTLSFVSLMVALDATILVTALPVS